MNSEQYTLREITRRHFFGQCAVGVGALALNQLLSSDSHAALKIDPANPMAPRAPHFAPKAKRVIYLFMAGGPSQLDLFDHKPELAKFNGKKPPASLMSGKRFAFLKGNETLLSSPRKFETYGQSGMTLSELFPHHRKIVDDVCWMKGISTDVFNHGPAKLFMNTGFQAPGRASMGSWVTYGLGSAAKDLPGFVVLQSGPRGPRAGAQLWSSGFLPTSFQGVPLRGSGDPILNLRSPEGMTRQRERKFYDAVADLNKERLAATGDPEILTRLNAYETAYQMQTSAPELMDLSGETPATLEQYGCDPAKPSYARNCLLARRLIERGVRFVQLYHTNWDSHGGQGENLNSDFESLCRDVDQASAALVADLKQRGLLDDTLVIWGGEFGRTPMGENRATLGRDHHIDAFTMWMAGGGAKPGVFGETDELGFGAVNGKIHVHDLHATMMHLLGFDHEHLNFRVQGLDMRLTGVFGKVVKDILA
jgi:hypothetical protein